MSLLEQKVVAKAKPKGKRKVKYVIVASDAGQILGAFQPDKIIDARKYLAAMQKKDPTCQMHIYHVSNYNQFLANLRYGKRKKRKSTE